MNSTQQQIELEASIFYDAVYQGVKNLLFSSYFDVNTRKITKNSIATDTAIQALNLAIGYGGGHTLSPHVGTYFIFEYWPGIKASLFRHESEIIIKEKVSRSLIIQVAEKCLKEWKGQGVQLSLF